MSSTPLGGATFRNTIDDNNYTVQGVTTTERPARFNPDGVGNTTPEVDSIGGAGPWLAGSSADRKYPPFMDAYVR